ncbi:hypothetical protein MHC_01095 [Mycoplasma haemocanis str. Illinois]|uniref:Uncharacterized protein n=1 Tax=Mycoplasma haemocanis (strain Illinois) TaxID=1111676 RepID=H6N613_MYCHN|nr:hypothetical protein MHC_01095 [Mycoplasma haemocanis str. Illinois]
MPTFPFLIKGVSGLTIASVVSVGSIYFGTDLLKSKKAVSDLIKDLKKNRRLISGSSVSDPFWKTAWKQYRVDNNSRTTDMWNIKGWARVAGDIPDDNAPQDFIDSCMNKQESKRAR